MEERRTTYYPDAFPGSKPAPEEPGTAPPGKYGPCGEISAATMLANSGETIPCLLEPIIQQTGLAAVVGSSDTGKSAFLRAFGASIVCGEESFIGFKLNPRYRRVIYVSTEDDDLAIGYLLRLQNKEKRLPIESYAGLEYIFDTENLVKRLAVKLSQAPVDMVIIDAFADLYVGALNENNRVRAFLQEYNDLATKYGCLFLFLHHTGKRTEDLVPSKHNAIGSQGFEAKMRLLIELRNDQMDPQKRHLCIVKGNYLPREYKQESFELHFSDNMTFSNTGGRTSFEYLKKIDERKREELDEKAEQILEMKDKGMKLEEIAVAMGYRSKGSISKILKRYGK